jgi:hypothetical protein
MTYEEAQAALEGLAAEEGRLRRAADIRGLRSLRHARTDLRARIAEIQVETLKGRVAYLEASRQQTLTQMSELATQADDQARQARADAERASAELQDAEGRLTAALSMKDRIPTMCDGINDELRQARERLDAAVRSVIDD